MLAHASRLYTDLRPLAMLVLGLTLVALPPTWVRGDFLVAAGTQDEIVRFSDKGAPLGNFVQPESGGLNAPFAMAWGPDGNLYVGGSFANDPSSNKQYAHLFVYDGETGAFLRRTHVPISGQIFGLHFVSNGDLLLSQSAGQGSAVCRINPLTGEVLARATHPWLDAPGKMLSMPDGRILVGSTSGLNLNKIFAMDPATSTITGVFAEAGGMSGPFGMEFGPDGMIYAANLYGDGGIRRIDPASGEVLGAFGEIPLRTTCSDLVFDQDGGLWTANLMSGGLSRYSATTGQFLYSVSGPSYPWDILHMPEPGSIALPLGLAALCQRRRMRAE